LHCKIYSLKKPLIFAFFALLLVSLACVEPYSLVYSTQSKILFIEADLNDFDINQNITIRRNVPSDKSPMFEFIEDAKVTVLENNATEIFAKHSVEGVYNLPPTFKIKVNVPYKLKVVLANGVTYESSLETASKAPAIDSVYSIFKTGGIEYDDKLLPGHEIYLDLKDSPTKDEYYLWRWKLYEKKDYCISCFGGKYFTNPQPNGICVEDRFLKQRGAIYDYLCRTDCWKIIYSDKFNIMSDQYNNGLKIKARLLGNIPFLQFRSALVQAEQYLVSKKTYDYFNIAISQGQNTGSLADTPPVGLIGNFKNTQDSEEPVGGIFSVASKTIKTYWLKRPERSPGIFPYGLFQGGRLPTPEPSGLDTTRPPLAPCIEDRYSTGKQPFGWLQ
jgi:Domain of unknown function (DUF4249)